MKAIWFGLSSMGSSGVGLLQMKSSDDKTTRIQATCVVLRQLWMVNSQCYSPPPQSRKSSSLIVFFHIKGLTLAHLNTRTVSSFRRAYITALSSLHRFWALSLVCLPLEALKMEAQISPGLTSTHSG